MMKIVLEPLHLAATDRTIHSRLVSEAGSIRLRVTVTAFITQSRGRFLLLAMLLILMNMTEMMSSSLAGHSRHTSGPRNLERSGNQLLRI